MGFERTQKAIRSTRFAWVWLFVFSLLVAHAERAPWVGDTGGYFACAEALVDQSIYPSDNNYFAYPCLIALSFAFFGRTLLAVHFFPFLCAVFAPLLLAKVALRAGVARPHAFGAGGLLVIFPFQAFHVNRPLTEPLVVFFLLLALWFFLALRKTGRAWLGLLPVLSWLVLIRYDTILFVVIVLGGCLWQCWCLRRFAWKWLAAGLVIAALMQVPFARLNKERAAEEHRHYVELHRPELVSAIERFVAELPQRLALPDGVGDATPIIPLEQITAIYDELVPKPRPPLSTILSEHFHPEIDTEIMPPAEKSNWSWLPLDKIRAWISVGQHGVVDWLKRLVLKSSATFPLWGIVALVLCSIGLLGGVAVSLWQIVQRPTPYTAVLAVFFCLYLLLAVLLIQGAILRHLARLTPITILLFVHALGPWSSRRVTRKWIGWGTLFLGCAVVNLTHHVVRADLYTCSFLKIVTANPSVTGFAGNMSRKVALEHALFDHQIPEEDPLTYIDDFTEGRHRLRMPPGQTDGALWSADRPGRIGLRGSMFPAELVQVFDYDTPLVQLQVETWGYQVYPELTPGDAIFVGVSIDQGRTWTEQRVPAIKQRQFHIQQEYRDEVRGARSVWVRFRFVNHPRLFIYLNHTWYTVLSNTPGFFGMSGAHVHRYLRVAAEVE